MLADCLRVPGTQRLHHVAPQDQTPTQASGPAAFAALPGMDLGETHVVMSHEVLYADACPCPILILLIITPRYCHCHDYRRPQMIAAALRASAPFGPVLLPNHFFSL